MQTKLMQRFYLTAIIVLVTLCLMCTGCISRQQPPETKSSQDAAGFDLNITNPKELEWPSDLEKAFRAYWRLRYTDQFEAAYQTEVPGFREKVTFDQYKSYVRRTSSKKLLELRLEKINIREDLSERYLVIDVGCRFLISGKQQGSETIESYIEDRWVYKGGKWSHVLRNRLLFPEVDLSQSYYEILFSGLKSQG